MALVDPAAARRRTRDSRELWVSIAAPGARFRTPVRIADPRDGVASSTSRSATPGTRCSRSERCTDVLRRRARAWVVTSGGRPSSARPPDISAVATRPPPCGADGGGVVAWHGDARRRARAPWCRERPGPFGAPLTITRRRAPRARSLGLLPDSPAGGVRRRTTTSELDRRVSGDDDNRSARAAIVVGGRALLTWAAAPRRAAASGGSRRVTQSATIAALGHGVETARPRRRAARVSTRSRRSCWPAGVRAVAWSDATAPTRTARSISRRRARRTERIEPAPRVRVVGPAEAQVRRRRQLAEAEGDVLGGVRRARPGSVDAALEPPAPVSRCARAGSGGLRARAVARADRPAARRRGARAACATALPAPRARGRGRSRCGCTGRRGPPLRARDRAGRAPRR